MPDFERVFDELELYLCIGDEKRKAYVMGKIDGKNEARWQVAKTAVVVATVVILLSLVCGCGGGGCSGGSGSGGGGSGDTSSSDWGAAKWGSDKWAKQ
jgi:hypothetical protein